jgi:hypothetical protein
MTGRRSEIAGKGKGGLLPNGQKPAGGYDRGFMKACIVICGLLLWTGCAWTEKNVAWDSSRTPMVHYRARTYADWNPELAETEAREDLSQGKPKIYVAGPGFGSPPGVDPADYPRIAPLQKAAAGVGAFVPKKKEMRLQQVEYARRYNEYVVRHLPVAQ